MKLRHPNPGDLAEIVALARLMHQESWFHGFDFDDQKVVDLIRAAMEDERYFPLVLEANDGGLGGFFLAAETEHFFGKDRYACDMALYLLPWVRGGVWFLRIMRAYEAWCAYRGVQEIHVGFSTGVNNKVTPNLYRRLGYESTVNAFRKKCV